MTSLSVTSRLNQATAALIDDIIISWYFSSTIFFIVSFLPCSEFLSLFFVVNILLFIRVIMTSLQGMCNGFSYHRLIVIIIMVVRVFLTSWIRSRMETEWILYIIRKKVRSLPFSPVPRTQDILLLLWISLSLSQIGYIVTLAFCCCSCISVVIILPILLLLLLSSLFLWKPLFFSFISPFIF